MSGVIVIHMSDGRKLEIPNGWDRHEQTTEWRVLEDCMEDKRIFYPSSNCNLMINTTQIATAEYKEVKG